MNVRIARIALLSALFLPAIVFADATSTETAPEKNVADDSVVSPPAQPDAASIGRMTAHLMKMMPIDRFFEQVIESNRTELKSQLDAAQYACMMRELSQDALTARKRGEVQRFAETHPDAFVSGLKVLDDGAADLIAKTVESSITGVEFDMTKADGDAVIAFVTFAFDEKLADLRTVSGFGDLNAANGSSRSTEAMMNALAADLSKTCAIPAEFFE